MNIPYNHIEQNCTWLENARGGRFSRYAIGNEESVWVDHERECVADPDDDDGEDEDDGDLR